MMPDKDEGPDPGALPPATTPMMRQYERLRKQLPPDVLVFFRLGDFFELFGPDAVKGAPLLNVALTKRNGLAMCGVPAHALDIYLAKLVKQGQRVAVCDQVGEAKPGVLVDREIARIVTAGTVTDGALLDASRNHYLAAVVKGKANYGFAYLDLTHRPVPRDRAAGCAGPARRDYAHRAGGIAHSRRGLATFRLSRL